MMFLFECNATNCTVEDGGLLDSWNMIQQQSVGECFGDDCFEDSYNCSVGTSETFTMQSLESGSYIVMLMAFDDHNNEQWELDVICDPPTTSTPTVQPTTYAPTMPTTEPTAFVAPQVGCNDAVTGTFGPLSTTKVIIFNLTEIRDVTFTNCDRFVMWSGSMVSFCQDFERFL